MFKLKLRKMRFVSGSQYIALPLSWVRHHNLERNAELKISLNEDNHLVVEPYKENEND